LRGGARLEELAAEMRLRMRGRDRHNSRLTSRMPLAVSRPAWPLSLLDRSRMESPSFRGMDSSSLLMASSSPPSSWMGEERPMFIGLGGWFGPCVGLVMGGQKQELGQANAHLSQKLAVVF
jgi:hypothetical protein